MLRPIEHFLVIAISARALVCAANRAGFRVDAMDCFADADTRDQCHYLGQLEMQSGCIELPSVERILGQIQRDSYDGVILGSGFEQQPEIQDRLLEYGPVRGNSIDTIRKCKDQKYLVKLLERLQIKYPATLFVDKVPGVNWLAKKPGANGGVHVLQPGDGAQVPEGYYLQQRIDGTCCSIVFLANGSDACILGTNELQAVNAERGDFRYAGAISNSGFLRADQNCLSEIIMTLTGELELRGLCGIDFIKSPTGELYLLEINPRPTATFELHQSEAFNLFRAHVAACQGHLPASVPTFYGYRGQQIIYANTDLEIPSPAWPDWVSDRPLNGTNIRQNEPVCTIHAQASSFKKVTELLKNRRQRLAELLGAHKIAA